MRSRVLYSSLLLLMLFSTLGYAQNVRVVRGIISDKDGQPLKEVKVTTPAGETIGLKDVGQFEIRVPSLTRSLTFSAPYFHDVKKEIDGTYLRIVMESDNSALQKVEKERLAAEEIARKEEEARVKAEEDAKARAQKEEDARIKAEEAAKARAQKEEEARRKAEKAASDKAERQSRDAAYDEKYVNKGVANSVRVSYAYQMAKTEAVYYYSGYREYGSLHPFSVDYTLSYKFNRTFSLGVGAGILMHAKSVTIVGDRNYCQGFKERRLDVPVFVTAASRFGRWKLRPVLALSAGYYLLGRTLLAEGMIGMEYRLGKRPSIEVGALVKTTPYPYFDVENGSGKYKMAVSPGAALRFNF